MQADLTDDIVYLNALKAETEQLNKTRKFYKLQSEWLRLMYAKTLEIETLEKVLNRKR